MFFFREPMLCFPVHRPTLMAKELFHIGLMVDASRAYGRGICHGVADFANRRKDWVIVPHERPESDGLPESFKRTRLDGLIAYIPNRRLYRKIAETGIPAVDVQGSSKGPLFPVIESDSEGIARTAVDFFVRASFRRLAYCGYPQVFFSDLRERAFVRFSRERGIVPEVYGGAKSHPVGDDFSLFERGAGARDAELESWLESLPKPVAILACNDIRGQQVINACRDAGIRVPDEVAVLGVDNDEVICRLCHPPLSSIDPNVRIVGELAARLLDDMIHGRPVSPGHRVPPVRVVERASTDIIAVEDGLVQDVLRKIRDRACVPGGVAVEQLCGDVGVSRSTLDKRFVDLLGRSVSEEITRHRLHHARQLLLSGDTPLGEVSARCGFTTTTYFCRFFKRETGGTPEGFRRANRVPA